MPHQDFYMKASGVKKEGGFRMVDPHEEVSKKDVGNDHIYDKFS